MNRQIKFKYVPNIEKLVDDVNDLTKTAKEVAVKTKEENFTVDRKYATLNNGELMLIQDYVFNKVLINIAELRK